MHTVITPPHNTISHKTYTHQCTHTRTTTHTHTSNKTLFNFYFLKAKHAFLLRRKLQKHIIAIRERYISKRQRRWSHCTKHKSINIVRKWCGKLSGPRKKYWATCKDEDLWKRKALFFDELHRATKCVKTKVGVLVVGWRNNCVSPG